MIRLQIRDIAIKILIELTLNYVILRTCLNFLQKVFLQLPLKVLFLYILISLVAAPSVRHRGRQGSPVGNDPFLGAGQHPAQKGVVEGVRERVSGFLSFDKK